MIRNLVGLGIPAEALLREAGAKLPSDAALQQGKHFPVAACSKSPAGPRWRKTDARALTAWRIRVATSALEESLPAYLPGTVNADFLKELAPLSCLADGPKLAREFLNKSGIHLILEPHLPKTHLDGAALKLPNGSLVVALTLRRDRLDNFWFTLFHELAHVALRLEKDDVDAYFDDLTEDGAKDKCEQEADKLASEALIPETAWKAAKLTKKSPARAAVAFAQSQRISPAIPAGRIRYESKNYTVLKPLLGGGKLRPMFGIGAN